MKPQLARLLLTLLLILLPAAGTCATPPAGRTSLQIKIDSKTKTYTIILSNNTQAPVSIVNSLAPKPFYGARIANGTLLFVRQQGTHEIVSTMPGAGTPPMLDGGWTPLILSSQIEPRHYVDLAPGASLKFHGSIKDLATGLYDHTHTDAAKLSEYEVRLKTQILFEFSLPLEAETDWFPAKLLLQ